MMIDRIREYLEDEFECDVAVSPVEEADTGAQIDDQCLSFTFRGTAHTILVTAATLRQPPQDVTAFLTDREETLADFVVLADGQTVVVRPTGFSIAESATTS